MIEDKDELLKVQSQVIGILFEVLKRLQAINTLDNEYYEIIISKTKLKHKNRLDTIMQERSENAKIVNRLLAQLDPGVNTSTHQR